MFCAGCHGLNGIAGYVGAPSFALGERMEKSDRELMGSITGGHEVMPEWGDKLPDGLLIEALRFAGPSKASSAGAYCTSCGRLPRTTSCSVR
jgi:hypothetical protein